jgi:hypothetical protein
MALHKQLAKLFNDKNPPFPTLPKKNSRRKVGSCNPKVEINIPGKTTDQWRLNCARALLPGILRLEVQRWPGDVRQEAPKMQKKNRKMSKRKTQISAFGAEIDQQTYFGLQAKG